MSEEVLESFTRQYIQAQPGNEVTFGWQGGEPTLMGIDFFRRAVELQEKYRRPGMHILNSLQTNATRLDDAWCQFFHDHQFLLGVSLDGPQELHDSYRVDRAGHPTFDRVMAGIDLLKQYKVEFNLLACVNHLTAKQPREVYRFFRDQVGAKFIQFIPVVERSLQPGKTVSDRSVNGSDYGSFLKGVFDEWVRTDVGLVYVQLFDIALAAWSGYPPGLCVYEETCGYGLALEHNGDLYACDHFVSPEYLLGNITEKPMVEMVESDQQRRFGEKKSSNLPRKCHACSVRFACNGGCPKDRLIKSEDGDPGLNYLCKGFYAFFTYIDRPMCTMAAFLQAGRAPAEIMDILPNEKSRKRHK